MAPDIMSNYTAPSVISPTSASAASLPKTLLSPDDIGRSIDTYESLLRAAKDYRNELATLSKSANAFGAALEECSRTKGVDEVAESLLNVAGLQYLVANHQSVLSDTIYRSFEIPLRETLENFVADTQHKREEYEFELAAKKKLLAKREKAHIALAQKKQRSLSKFREALSDLTRLADDIDRLKSDYFYNALDYHSETWNRVAVRSKIVCKAELSLYSGIAQKAEHLEFSLIGTPDPWTEDPRSGDEMFNIVPPQEILARPQSPTHDQVTDSIFQSLLGAVGPPGSAGPPRRLHSNHGRQNGGEVEQSEFFSVQDDKRIFNSLKSDTPIKQFGPRPESVRDMMDHPGFDENLSVDKLDIVDPASPYQDAEEEREDMETTDSAEAVPEGDSVDSRLNQLSKLFESEFETPSRSSSKRSNLQSTPQRRPGMLPHDPITPRSRPISGFVNTVREKIECKKEERTQSERETSSETSQSLKHTEYSPFTPCKIKIEPRE